MSSKEAATRSAFQSCRGLISEASEGLRDFEANLEAHYRDSRPRLFLMRNQEVQRCLLAARLPPTPDVLQRKAYRVVNDARNALDQAVYAGTFCLKGKPSGPNTYFPFARDRDDFETLFGKTKKGKPARCCDVAEDLRPHLRAMKPWWPSKNQEDGDAILRILGKISGPNKHQVSLAPCPDLQNVKYGGDIVAGVSPVLNSNRIPNTNDFILARLEQGARLGSVTVTYFLTFVEPPSLFGANAYDMLKAFLATASDVVSSIEIHTIEIGRRPPDRPRPDVA